MIPPAQKLDSISRMISMKKTDLNRRSTKKSQGGFTLIEVVIAMGIIASGMLLLVGLMPYGVQNMHEASSKAMERRISQNIISDMLLHDWDKLHEFNHTSTGIRFFDDYGIELEPADSDEATYRVRVRVVPRDVRLDHSGTAITSSAGYSLNDDTAKATAAGTVSNLRRVLVDITNIPDPAFDTASKFGSTSGPADPVTDKRVRTYSTIISNMMDVDSINN